MATNEKKQKKTQENEGNGKSLSSFSVSRNMIKGFNDCEKFQLIKRVQGAEYLN
jgi:hypothetical protein